MKLPSVNPFVFVCIVGFLCVPGVLVGVPAAEVDELFPDDPPDVEIQPVDADSPYVTVVTDENGDDGDVHIEIDDPGVNTNAKTTFNGLVELSYSETVDQPLTVTTELETETDANVSLYKTTPTATADTIQLDPGEGTELGLLVDTTSPSVSVDEVLEATITIEAAFDALPDGISDITVGEESHAANATAAPVANLPDDQVDPDDPPPPSASATVSAESVMSGDSVVLTADGTTVSGLASLTDSESPSDALVTDPVELRSATTDSEPVAFTVDDSQLGATGAAAEDLQVVYSPSGTHDWKILETEVQTRSEETVVSAETAFEPGAIFALVDDPAVTYSWADNETETLSSGFATEWTLTEPGEREFTLTVNDGTDQTDDTHRVVNVDEDTSGSSEPEQTDDAAVDDPSPDEDVSDGDGDPSPIEVVDATVDTDGEDDGDVGDVDTAPLSQDEIEAIEATAEDQPTAQIDVGANIEIGGDVATEVAELDPTTVSETVDSEQVATATGADTGGELVSEDGETETEVAADTEAAADGEVQSGSTVAEDEAIINDAEVTNVQFDQDAAAASGEPVTVTETDTTFSGQRSTVGSTGSAVTDATRVTEAVSVTPSDESATGGEVELAASRTLIEQTEAETDDVAVGHFTGDGWELLSTEVSIRDGRLIARAETDSFSPFAVFIKPDVEYTWEFPDGTIKTGQEVDHAFSEPGEQLVKLTVTDALGQSATAEQPVIVDDIPIATPTVSETAASGDEQVEVTLESDIKNEVGAVDLTWEFPDGTTATGAEATHVLEHGEHVVTVIAVDEYGGQSRTEITVGVGPTGFLEEATNEVGILVTVLVSLSALTGLVMTYRMVNWRAFLIWCRRTPRITTLKGPKVDFTNQQLEIGELRAIDCSRSLTQLTVQLRTGGGRTDRPNEDVVFQTEILLSSGSGLRDGVDEYVAVPEQLMMPPNVTGDPTKSYVIRVEAENAAGQTDEAWTHPFTSERDAQQVAARTDGSSGRVDRSGLLGSGTHD